MQRQGVGAGWRWQTASPGAGRCAEGPAEPYPYHLFIDCAPSSHSGAGYCSWHGAVAETLGRRRAPRCGAPRGCLTAPAARAERSPAPGGGGRGWGGRDTGTLLSPGNPASLPRASLPQRPDWTGRGGGNAHAPPRMLRPGTATCRILKKPGAGRVSAEQPGVPRQFRACITVLLPSRFQLA